MQRLTAEQRHELLEELQESLPYVIQVRNPDGTGEAAEWMTDWDVGVIIGKSAAHQKRIEFSKKHSHLNYRVIKKCDADMYQAGIHVGRKLAGTKTRSHHRRPLMAFPDNM